MIKKITKLCLMFICVLIPVTVSAADVPPTSPNITYTSEFNKQPVVGSDFVYNLTITNVTENGGLMYPLPNGYIIDFYMYSAHKYSATQVMDNTYTKSPFWTQRNTEHYKLGDKNAINSMPITVSTGPVKTPNAPFYMKSIITLTLPELNSVQDIVNSNGVTVKKVINKSVMFQINGGAEINYDTFKTTKLNPGDVIKFNYTVQNISSRIHIQNVQNLFYVLGYLTFKGPEDYAKAFEYTTYTGFANLGTIDIGNTGTGSISYTVPATIASGSTASFDYLVTASEECPDNEDVGKLVQYNQIDYVDVVNEKTMVTKSVSDSDENGIKNTLNDKAEEFEYTITYTFDKDDPSTWSKAMLYDDFVDILNIKTDSIKLFDKFNNPVDQSLYTYTVDNNTKVLRIHLLQKDGSYSYLNNEIYTVKVKANIPADIDYLVLKKYIESNIHNTAKLLFVGSDCTNCNTGTITDENVEYKELPSNDVETIIPIVQLPQTGIFEIKGVVLGMIALIIGLPIFIYTIKKHEYN